MDIHLKSNSKAEVTFPAGYMNREARRRYAKIMRKAANKSKKKKDK